MNEYKHSEKPEVYALRQDEGNWQISRRDFLKAAGIGAAALGIGVNSGCSPKKLLDDVCLAIPSQDSDINSLACSEDGKYLLTFVTGGWSVRCWDFDKQALIGKADKYLHSYHTIGTIDGKSCVLINPNYGSQYKRGNMYYYELPISDASEDISINRNSDGFNQITMDSKANLYAADLDGNIHYFSKDSDYQQDETIYQIPSGAVVRNIQVFGGDKSLLVHFSTRAGVKWSYGLGVLDLSLREMTLVEGNCVSWAILPDNSGILMLDEQEYRLITPDGGSEIWNRKAPAIDSVVTGDVNIAAGTVTADNSSVILLLRHEYANHYHYFLTNVSMADGSVQFSYDLTKLFDASHDYNKKNYAGPVVSHDGTGLAVSIGNSLLFFSLPDLKLSACPIDVDAARDDTKGIEVSAKDSVTGESYTYTMPCGAEIPSGAVCTCNCVTGRGGCACDSYVKSNSGRSNGNSGSGGGSHYWHPN